MKMNEFMTTHCQDILTRKAMTLNNPYSWYKFDDLEDGIPVIYDKQGAVINVEDIITMTFEDFCQVYAGDSSAEAYTTYLKAFRIIEGMDLVMELRNDLKAAREAAKEDADIARKALGLSAGI